MSDSIENQNGMRLVFKENIIYSLFIVNIIASITNSLENVFLMLS